MRRWIFIGFGLICAAALTQVPTFHQQYMQRLGGHIDELSTQVAALDERAAKVNMGRYDYIRNFLDNDDQAVKLEGEHLREMVTRHVSLKNSLDRLRTVPMIYLGALLVVELDPDIAANTAKSYRPAIPLTLAGVGYGIVGFFLGFFGLMFLFSLFTWEKVPVPEEEARVQKP